MSDYVIPPPEPKEIDEKLSMQLRILSSNAVLKGVPSGAEKCENCLYYLEPTALISYCWHSKLRILVGAEWWCQWWEAIPEE
jgi:hypothetical protein